MIIKAVNKHFKFSGDCLWLTPGGRPIHPQEKSISGAEVLLDFYGGESQEGAINCAGNVIDKYDVDVIDAVETLGRMLAIAKQVGRPLNEIINGLEIGDITVVPQRVFTCKLTPTAIAWGRHKNHTVVTSAVLRAVDENHAFDQFRRLNPHWVNSWLMVEIEVSR